MTLLQHSSKPQVWKSQWFHPWCLTMYFRKTSQPETWNPSRLTLFMQFMSFFMSFTFSYFASVKHNLCGSNKIFNYSDIKCNKRNMEQESCTKRVCRSFYDKIMRHVLTYYESLLRRAATLGTNSCVLFHKTINKKAKHLQYYSFWKCTNNESV